MDADRHCPSCHKPLPAGAPQGLCPECLMKAGFGTGARPGSGGGDRPPFVPPTPSALARLFPQFEILELVGQGGMGAVYRARQPALDRIVALKILPPQTIPGFAERFTREARALAKLNHPNIVGVYDFGQVAWDSSMPEFAPQGGGLHYFVMEYVEGPNLRQLEQAGRLSPREALKIIPQICDALQFAHDEGVVHRDIKPENVMLDKKGRVKITDFGLAKILGREVEDLRLTGARDVMGTPIYMAPEQIEHPQAVDHRADIYSLGVVFYELLTGELPLGKFQPPSRKVQVDVRLDDVVLHALEKEPERRYQHASQVKSDLETIDSGKGGLAAEASGSHGSAKGRAPVSASGAKRDPFWRWFAAAALLLVATAVVVFLFASAGWLKSRQRTGEPFQPGAAELAQMASAAGSGATCTQSQMLELLPDTTIRFESSLEVQNDTGAPLETYRFRNSDFVTVTNMLDARRRPLAFEVTHDGRLYSYVVTLKQAVPPAGKVTVITQGTMSGLVTATGMPSVYEYSMRHWPSNAQRTRRVEIHRLPVGARLLDKQPADFRAQIRAGRVELAIDRLIPPGDSLEVIYHYRLEGS